MNDFTPLYPTLKDYIILKLDNYLLTENLNFIIIFLLGAFIVAGWLFGGCITELIYAKIPSKLGKDPKIFKTWIKKGLTIVLIFFIFAIIFIIISSLVIEKIPDEGKFVIIITPVIHYEIGDEITQSNGVKNLDATELFNASIHSKLENFTNPNTAITYKEQFVKNDEKADLVGRTMGAHVVIYGKTTEPTIGSLKKIGINIYPTKYLSHQFQIIDAYPNINNPIQGSLLRLSTDTSSLNVTILENKTNEAVLTLWGLKNYYEKNYSEAISIFENIPNYVDDEKILQYRAASYYQIKDVNTSLILYQELINKYPNHIQNYNEIGNIYLDLNNFDRAAEYYNKSLEIEPNNNQTLHSIGILLSQQGEFNESIKYYDNALSIKPDSPEILNNKGWSLYSIGQFNAAEKNYDHALQLNPNLGDVYLNKAILYYEVGEYSKAIENCDKALEINPRDNVALGWKGKILFSIGRYRESINNFNKSLSIEPNRIGVWVNLANSYEHLGNVEESQKCLLRSLEIQPKKSNDWTGQGFALDKLGRLNESERYYYKALELNSNEFDAWNNLGYLYNKLGKYNESLNCFEHALMINPNDANANFGKGSTLIDMGQFETGISYINHTLELIPNDSEYLRWTGRAFSQKQLYNKSLEYYQKSVIINPNGIYIWNDLGDVFFYQKDYSKAIKFYEKTLEIDPKNLYSINQIGRAKLEMGLNIEALEFFNKTLGIDPNSVYGWNNKGVVYYRLGNYDIASECYWRSLTIKNNNSLAWQGLGDIYYQQNEYSQAIKYYNQSIQIDPKNTYTINQIGLINLDRRLYSEAEENFNKAIEIEPNNEVYWNNLGFTYSSWERDVFAEKNDDSLYDKSLNSYDRAINLNPLFLSPLFNKARLIGNQSEGLVSGYKKENNYQNEHIRESFEIYNKILTIDPKNGDAWNEKGEIYEHSLSQPRVAQICYDNALLKNPNYWHVLFNKVQMFESLEMPNDALKTCDEMLVYNPLDAAAWRLKSQIYRDDLHQSDEADRCLEQASLLYDIQDRINQKTPIIDSYGSLKRDLPIFRKEYPGVNEINKITSDYPYFFKPFRFYGCI